MVASVLDTCVNVLVGIWMYIRKQSLVHLPSCWMSQRGNPPDGAVVAAPILKEWDDTGDDVDDGMALFRRLFRRRRVRRVLLA